MKRRLAHLAVNAMILVALTALAFPTLASASGVTRISGVAYAAGPGECTDPEGVGSNLILRMTGDLQGCHYIFVESTVCLPNGVFRLSGNEIFVAGDGSGTFRTHINFEARYQDCVTQLVEIFGRCQHPIIAGSGTGVYAGVSGRLDFKDDVETGAFYYRGSLRY